LKGNNKWSLVIRLEIRRIKANKIRNSTIGKNKNEKKNANFRRKKETKLNKM